MKLTAAELDASVLGRALLMRAETTRGPVSRAFVEGAVRLLRTRPNAVAEGLFAAGIAAEVEIETDLDTHPGRVGPYSLIKAGHR